MMIDFDEDIESDTSGEWIVDGVYVGNNVSIITHNETNEQFWLLLMDKIIDIVEESFDDQWGNTYVGGDIGTRSYMHVVILTFLKMISLQHTYVHT